jgi:ribonuclease-3 family protein
MNYCEPCCESNCIAALMKLALPLLLLPHAALALASIPRPPPSEMVARLSPLALAYLGDSVWEREVRERMLWPPAKLDQLNRRVQQLCCAEGQHAVLQDVVNQFGLNEGELDWLRRGRNASPRGPRRLKPSVYQASTALETLVGVLHLTDRTRLQQLLDFALQAATQDADQLDEEPL